MTLKNLQRDLKTLHSIFSANEERVSQLTRRENYLRSKLSDEMKN